MDWGIVFPAVCLVHRKGECRACRGVVVVVCCFSTRRSGQHICLCNVTQHHRILANPLWLSGNLIHTARSANGTDVLDIGTDFITFDGSTSLSPAWGPITLARKITAAITQLVSTGKALLATVIIMPTFAPFWFPTMLPL
ncbi:hypothetical protein R83H12_02828 [Fibrobacteria bacterium R8-3-H12]